MHATLIAEDFAGMWSQGRGLAERAGFSWECEPVLMRKADPWQRLPVRLWPSPLKRVEPLTISSKTDLIISLGGRGGVVGAALGERLRLPVVQIQNPRLSLKKYMLVVANQHDRLTGDNVFEARTALHGVTEAVLEQARTRWHRTIRAGRKPVLGVLLGGSNGRFRFEEKEAAHIADIIKDFMCARQAECVVTPSRRTGQAALALLKERLEPIGARFLDGKGEENPYIGLLACSDILAVTTDSVSMVSEAVATSLPVGILPLSGHSSRITNFIRMLEKQGRVRSFSSMMSFDRVERLDDTSLAAEELWRRMKL